MGPDPSWSELRQGPPATLVALSGVTSFKYVAGPLRRYVCKLRILPDSGFPLGRLE
jgi:hypothetical protein